MKNLCDQRVACMHAYILWIHNGYTEICCMLTMLCSLTKLKTVTTSVFPLEMQNQNCEQVSEDLHFHLHFLSSTDQCYASEIIHFQNCYNVLAFPGKCIKGKIPTNEQRQKDEIQKTLCQTYCINVWVLSLLLFLYSVFRNAK